MRAGDAACLAKRAGRKLWVIASAPCEVDAAAMQPRTDRLQMSPHAGDEGRGDQPNARQASEGGEAHHRFEPGWARPLRALRRGVCRGAAS